MPIKPLTGFLITFTRGESYKDDFFKKKKSHISTAVLFILVETLHKY